MQDLKNDTTLRIKVTLYETCNWSQLNTIVGLVSLKRREVNFLNRAHSKNRF